MSREIEMMCEQLEKAIEGMGIIFTSGEGVRKKMIYKGVVLPMPWSRDLALDLGHFHGRGSAVDMIRFVLMDALEKTVEIEMAASEDNVVEV